MQFEKIEHYLQAVIPLSTESLAAFREAMTFGVIRKGDVLLREGQVATRYFLVESGYLRTYFVKDGKEINSRFTFEGEFTTNLKSLKSKEPSETTIAAGEVSEVWTIDIPGLVVNAERLPDIAHFLRRLHTRMLIREEEHANMFKLYNPSERYYYIEEQHSRLLQRVPLSQLASYLGVTRETLGNIRRRR